MLKEYAKDSELLLSQLPKGVFITVKGKEKINTMVIAWGHIGVIWGRPMFIAYVRYSRYTYDLLNEASDYTVNVPVNQDLSAALKLAGTQSGRDIDKFDQGLITPLKARKVRSPIIKECALHYECKLVYKQTQEPALIPHDIKTRYYQNHDTHIMFYGEIVDTYKLKGENDE